MQLQYQCSAMNLLEILAAHVQHRFAQANSDSTNTIMHFVHYYCPLNITKSYPEYHIYFMVEDWDIHKFTLTGN